MKSQDRYSPAEIVRRASADLKNTYEAAIAAVERIAHPRSGGPSSSATPNPTTPSSKPAKDLQIICTTTANATIREGIDGRRHFVIHGPLKDLDDSKIGDFRGVFQAKIFSQSDLVAYPEPPPEPFDRPYAVGEPEWTPLMNPAKSEWSFDRVGHLIRGSGLGLSRIAPRPAGGTTFWYGVTSFVSWQHGPVVQCLGQATSLVTATFPTTPALLDGMAFPAQIVHTLSLAPVG